MWFFLIDGVIQKEGLYVYYMHNIEDKHFNIRIASVKWGGSLVKYEFNKMKKFSEKVIRLKIV
jgi:hypothetical protein